MRAYVKKVRRPCKFLGWCWSHLEVYTNATTEWGWVVGRMAVIATVAIGTVLFLRGTSVYGFILVLVTLVLAYNAILAFLLSRGLFRLVFFIGLVMDNAALLAGWAVVDPAVAQSGRITDLYLILFPVLSVGVARLGWGLGAIYTVLWVTWMSWSTIHYYGWDSYPGQQIPLRILFMVITGGLTVRLVSRLRQERQRAEELWHRSEEANERYRTLHDTMSDSVMVTNQEGVLVDVNPATCLLLEATPEELKGRPLLELVSSQQHVPFQQAFERAARGRPMRIQLDLRSHSGAMVTVELHGAFVEVAGERLFHGVARDLTERQALEKQLIRQERLLALGQMASGIAHDLNNAVSPIIGFAELLLQKEQGLSARAKRYLNAIRTAGQDIAHIVGRVREFYRQRAGQEALSPVNLNEQVQQVVELTRPRWRDIPIEHGAMIDMRLDLQPTLPLMMGIPSEIREAITNLVFNSVDAMPQGGTLTIRTRAGTWSHGTMRYDADSPSHIALEVVDTGIGMDEQTRQRCLEPFFSTKGERGSGLGLAMVFGVMQRHEGSIDIESQLGKGTTVRLVFPIRVVSRDNTRNHLEVVMPATPLRVLCIDDERSLRELLREMLGSDGHYVEVAEDGREGLQAFHAALVQGQRFDAVITDLGMPHMDGREVARAIKEESPETLVIMLTGWGQHLKANGSTPHQVDELLSEPPSLNELRRALARVILPQIKN